MHGSASGAPGAGAVGDMEDAMTIDDYVRGGIDQLMAQAAAQASEFTDASGALVLAFMEAGNVLKAAWGEFLARKVSEEEVKS